jgi:hypothetical protein
MPELTNRPPPPVINSARVLFYAFVDEIAYRKWGTLYSGDVLVEKVPRLAICVNLGKDIGPMLFHCDEEWNVVGTSGAETVDEVKRKTIQEWASGGSTHTSLSSKRAVITTKKPGDGSARFAASDRLTCRAW